MIWGRGSGEYLRASKLQIVLQGKDFCLSMQVGRGSQPGTACGYTQCRVLRSLQHLHVKLSQVTQPWRMPGLGVQTICTRPSGTLECPNDVADRAFITFSRDLALALMSCVC